MPRRARRPRGGLIVDDQREVATGDRTSCTGWPRSISSGATWPADRRRDRPTGLGCHGGDGTGLPDPRDRVGLGARRRQYVQKHEQRAGVAWAIAEAILSTFRLEPPLLDQATRRLLHALSEHPFIIASGKPFGFVETLRDLLPVGADVVAPAALGLAKFYATQPDQSYALSLSEELIDIAMTLQRLGPRYREQGLDLFELLLAQNTFGARGVLAELDPPGRRGPLRTRRWIPKRPQRRRRRFS